MMAAAKFYENLELEGARSSLFKTQWYNHNKDMPLEMIYRPTNDVRPTKVAHYASVRGWVINEAAMTSVMPQGFSVGVFAARLA